MAYYSCVVVLVLSMMVSGELCPKKCDCDLDNGLNRASCVNQNIVDINIGVPKEVQVYSLSHNVISELDNYCFKEAGYISLEILNLSYNAIFWIGLHAFADVEKLHHLDLSNNRLRYIPSDLFWDTPRLSILDLSSNIFEVLKNEPFIMHPTLEVLNLNNCRIKSLPERLFTRLPNLKKMDLSENYINTLNTQVFDPLRKLQRLELRNGYWKCTTEFINAESWIVSRGITYQKQCKQMLPKMSEKMVSIVSIEKDEVDVKDVWNITEVITQPTEVQNTTPLSPFQKFDKEFSAVQAFVIGVEIGLAIGILGTFIWLRVSCSCRKINCTRPQVRQRNRFRQRRDDMRTSLLWSNLINPDLATPPSFRRQLSLPDRSPPYGVPAVRESFLQVDAVRLQNRAETPPPPYYESRVNMA